MKIALLSRNKKLYSSRRLIEAAESRGHEIRVVDALRCYMNITSLKPTIHYRGEVLENFDAVGRWRTTDNNKPVDTRSEYTTARGDKVELTNTLVMRRMSSVSPYPHWHYFDAYPPGNLRAVYRGNGIPLPGIPQINLGP